MFKGVDKEKIEKAKNRKHSVSSLELFNNCPYKYYLRYILGNYSKENPEHLTVGVAVHTALEEKVKGVPISQITKKLKKEIGEFSDYEDKVKKFIKTYLMDKNYLDTYEVLGVEYKFDIEIQGRNFTGMIDLILKNILTDEIIVLDYKTSKKVHSEDKLKGLQTLIYAHVVDIQFGKCDKVVYDFVFLEKDTKQTVDIDMKKINKSLNLKIKNIFKKMDLCFENEEFIPKPSILCGWCDFGTKLDIDKSLKGMCDFEGVWNSDFKYLSKKMSYVSKKDESDILGDYLNYF